MKSYGTICKGNDSVVVTESRKKRKGYEGEDERFKSRFY